MAAFHYNENFSKYYKYLEITLVVVVFVVIIITLCILIDIGNICVPVNQGSRLIHCKYTKFEGDQQCSRMKMHFN